MTSDYLCIVPRTLYIFGIAPQSLGRPYSGGAVRLLVLKPYLLSGILDLSLPFEHISTVCLILKQITHITQCFHSTCPGEETRHLLKTVQPPLCQQH